MIKKTIIYIFEMIISIIIMFLKVNGKIAYEGMFIFIGIILIVIFTTIYIRQVIKIHKEKVIFENEYKKAKQENEKIE